MQWESLLTEQVETFLDDLYEEDRDSHRLAKRSWCLSRTGQWKGVRWSTP
jgi:hypothetical protein